jgi:ABC-type nitrate/sulfonate/bicarbonate transport system ATPase subunit
MVDSESARSAPLLSLQGVRVRARGAVLIDGFDMELSSGEAVALVGPSGCGKSLLLRIAAGLDQPDGGERRAGDSRAAFVFQEGGLVRNVTVAENLRLPLYYKGLGYGAARDAASAALDAFGLTAVGDERPSDLLNETRLLVQFARAAAIDADLLFLDEPFSQLSRSAVARVGRWLAGELEKGKLAVMMSAVEPQSLPPIPVRILDLGPPTPEAAKGKDAPA